MNQKNITIIILIASIVLLGFVFFNSEKYFSPENGLKRASVGSAIVFVQIADTEAERTRGLSGSTALGDDEGMLFVFDQPLRPMFWMKEMFFSLDIIWISAEKKIVSVEKNVSPETFPKTFSPASSVRYVLEVPAGFFEKNNLQIGDPVAW